MLDRSRLRARDCILGSNAIGAGALRDSVVEGRTGVVFGAQTTLALATAIGRFARRILVPAEIDAHAHRSGEARFREKFTAVVDAELAGRDLRSSHWLLQPVAT